MSWQRLAFRSSAALLVTPSALLASCYLPMGTFDSDCIQVPVEPSAPIGQEVASSDSPVSKEVHTGPHHLTPVEWRGVPKYLTHKGSDANRGPSSTSAGPAVHNSGARSWPAEHHSSGDESSSSAIGWLKKWLGAAKEEGHLTAPLLNSEEERPASDRGRLQNGPSLMTASQRKADNCRNVAGEENGGIVGDPDAKLRGLQAQATSDVGTGKSSDLAGFEESALASGLKLNILLLVIGTRGDVQPMAALGRVLQEKYGHRVRVATHAPFKDAVEAQGLEFFPMPGNPNFLIDKMVSSSTSAQWSLPSSPSAILAVRRWFKGIIFSHWPACTAPVPSPGHQPISVQPARQSEAPHWSLNVAANDASTGSESGASLPSSFRKVEAEGRPSDADGTPSELESRMTSGQSAVPPQPASSATLQPAGSFSDLRVAALNGGSEAESLPASSRADLKPSVSAEFTPDLIVATPTTQVALSCAQALGVPLHVFYLMPYTRTRHLPHPLSGGTLPGPNGSKATRFSWSLIESVSALGVWNYVNRFRRQVLRLQLLPRGALSEFFLLEALAVPTTYAFSPDLVPRPRDWGDHIRVVNYVYDDSLTSRYQPSPLLQRFLDAGPPPVYIGFGSMKLDHTDDVMDTLITAVRAAGVRAVIHKRGWADDVDALQKRLAAFGTHRRGPRRGMDARKDRSASMDSADGGLRGRRASGSFVSDDILVYEEEVPHGWLFPRCQAVVTHGGAGTVGAALRAGKPVMVVPFWGDQFLWGQLVAAAGVGPSAVPVSKLTEDALANGLEAMSRDDVVRAAARLGERINSRENGVLAAAEHIQSSLPLEALRCDACGERSARAWACHKLQKLCPTCLQDLARGALKPPEVLPYVPLEWRLSRPRGDCCGMCPEKVFTPEQMREAGWRSSTAVRRVVGAFRFPQGDESAARRESPAGGS
ncbi:hypothetical protein KFL_003680070 [Klebsormidium nitens]|uniref:Uncharacterized protein n=1 Tax=Klebsormidium nitens TaxID=105231 RepID=A0A1Y1IFZ5_KLENI|nr:hypothetical protein KFL_003680070 [Klebsormidium nitens]|eukprot:GAQ87657.1 hypothetical protein KFL_003680070 [Klebsormidium nitens]